VAVAKVLNDFAKGNEKFVITGGAMPGQMMSAKQIAALAIAAVARRAHREADGHDAGAVAKLVRTMNEVPSKFVARARGRPRRQAGGVRLRRLTDPTISTRFRRNNMSAVQTEILDKISSMTVLELSELIKAMEDKFGVSAAAAVAVAGPPPAPRPPPPRSRPSSRSSSPRSARTRSTSSRPCAS
jgi:phage protein U